MGDRMKKRMRKTPPIIFVALMAGVAAVGFTRDFVCASSAQVAKAQPASPVEERIRRVEAGLVAAVVIKGTTPAMPLAERMKFYKVPGVSVAVVNNGKIEWARGFGVKDVSTNEPVTTETLFQAGSISKPVAALAALRLVQDGKLSLDEDVNARLVSWKLPDNEFTREKKVTLRRLLTHSAGLTVHGFPGYADGAQVPTLVQVLNGEKPANTEAIRVEAVPGTIWNYSGGGYTIMQQMLVDVAKKPFPDLVKQLVLDPAGMKHSAYDQPLSTERAKDAATAHVNGQPVKGRFHTYPEMAAAGLWTTPTDLAALIIELQKSLAGASNKIISKEMTAQMLSPQFGTWGLGPDVAVRGRTVEFSHGGSDEGFESFWAGFGDGRGAVVMTNGDRGSALAMEVLRAVAHEYGWAEHAPREREVAKVDPKIYESYVGDYEFKISSQLIITLGVSTEGGKLLIQQNGGVKREWLPASEIEYFSLSSGNTINFVKDAQGKVAELVIDQGGETYRGKKIR
jgi:CubicO group peptidase (beta-lactamase class C family)